MSDMDTDSDSGIDDVPSQSYPQYMPQLEYTSPPTRLQTLDLWLPRPLEESDPTTSVFIIYIHGGAWRDPTQDATCIQPALAQLLSKPSPALAHIAGIASLDYRLSPYANHPTDPSSPDDESRNAVWPHHLHDVRLALQYLGDEYGVGSKYRWIGIGHSCGATLLAQFVAGMASLPSEETREGVGIARRGPSSLILIAGIYDLRLMLSNHQPPSCPAHIAQIYKDFVEGAFGKDAPDAGFYDTVSPSHGAYVPEVCPSLKEMVLAYSPDDELIEPQQREVMAARLLLCGWVERGQKGERVVEIKNLTDGHDEVWQDGRQVAGLIGEAVGRMFGA